jgi:hypothetical protein
VPGRRLDIGAWRRCLKIGYFGDPICVKRVQLDQTGSDFQHGVADQAILKGLQAFSPGLRLAAP